MYKVCVCACVISLKCSCIQVAVYLLCFVHVDGCFRYFFIFQMVYNRRVICFLTQISVKLTKRSSCPTVFVYLPFGY